MNDSLPANINGTSSDQTAFYSNEYKLAAIFTQAAVGLSEISLEGRFLRANKELCRILGRSREEILTLDVQNITYAEDVSESLAAFSQVVETGVPVSVDKRYLRPDGELIWAHSSLTRLEDAQGQPIAVLVVTIDLTARKNAEAALRKSEERLQLSQKLEAVGQLAGGIAHDFNNLLTAILGYSELALRALEPNHPVRNSVEEIKKAGERSAALTRQLLAFSRKQVMQLKAIDLNRLIIDTKNLLQRLITENIKLTFNAKTKNATVQADLGQLTQVLVNLVVNARDAMLQGGTIAIATDAADFEADLHARLAYAVPGDYIKFSVSDTGVGIDDETLVHIFEPFYTTKETGRGTGLGLATVYGIVKQLKGYITVDSELGKGTIFSIYLPLSGKPENIEASAVKEPAQSSRAAETILLVEDEQAVRALIREILEDSAYIVIEAENGLEALALSELRKSRIDLLITDVVMPEMNGRELAEEIKKTLPDLKILFMSGYTDDIIMRHGISEDGINFIQKPFSTDELAAKVREVLDN